MDSHHWTDVVNYDEDDDLETILAIRRGSRGPVYYPAEDCDPAAYNTCGICVQDPCSSVNTDGSYAEARRIPLLFQTPDTPLRVVQEANTFTLGAYISPEYQAEGTTKEDAAFPFDKPNSLLHFGDLEAPLNPDSPLFVQQNVNLTPTSQSSHTRTARHLMSTGYGSGAESSNSVLQNVRSQSPTINHSFDSQPTRDATMTNPLTNKDFVSSMKANPYVGGLFTYKGISKEEVLKRLSVQTQNPRRQNKRVQQKKDSMRNARGEHARKSASRDEYRTFSITEAQQLPRTLKQTPSQDGAIPNTGLGSERFANSNGRPFLPVSPNGNPRAQGSRISEQMSVTLSTMLQQKALEYEKALKEFGCEYLQDHDLQQMLEFQMRPDVDYFVYRMQDEVNINVDAFKSNLEAWDVDIGVRVILQKYLFYGMLLRSISGANGDLHAG